MSLPAPLLSVRGLRTRFQTQEGMVTAVDGIDFDVYPGETLGLVGESGCGKSVTALSILRLLKCPPADIKGEAMFDNRNLQSVSSDEMRKIRGGHISMIFQEPMTSLNPILTIGEQIAEALRLHEGLSRPQAWEQAVEILRLVQIPAPETRVGQYPHKLSGGMRQRAMIAMALCCNPQLIFADEPTTALDVTIQAQIISLINRLKHEIHTAMVLITHDLGVVAQMALRVIVMYAGSIVEEAPVTELFKDPRHPYTRGLLRSVPVIGRKAVSGRRLAEIPGVVPNPLQMPKGCRFHPRCPDVMAICHAEQPPLTRLGPQRRVYCWRQGEGDAAEKGRNP
jgi:oligopeptide/dipeptide ABC transporter ATP-binding protein